MHTQTNKRNVVFLLKESSRARTDGTHLQSPHLGSRDRRIAVSARLSSFRISRAIFQDFTSRKKKLKKGQKKGWRKDNGARCGGFVSETLVLRRQRPEGTEFKANQN